MNGGKVRRWVVVGTAVLCVWVVGGALAVQAVSGPHPEQSVTIPRSGPIFFLLMGSDSRPGTDMVRGRSDVMLLVGVNRSHKRVTILGLHRDTWIHIPGHGNNRINAAMAFGGPRLAATTVRSVTGVPVYAWLVTGFTGFARMVDRIPGMDVDVPFPMYDPLSGAAFDPGPQRLNGPQSLAFVRDRHNVPDAVFGRVRNHGRFTMDSLRQFQREYTADHGRLQDWIAAGLANLKTNYSMGQVAYLGGWATKIPASRVNFVLVPARPGMAGAASVVYLTEQSRRLFADFRTDGMVG